MLIYHASVCHNFELRHCWQVSSILEQDRTPSVILDVAVLEGTDNPYRYPPHNFLRYYPTPRDTFAYRGLVRNEQIQRAKNCNADFIFFADCDHVYPPDFFQHLEHWLERNGCTTDKAISARRKLHTAVEPTNNSVWEHSYSHYVMNAWDEAYKLPMIDKRNHPIAGGAMQVVSLRAIDKLCGGRYVPQDQKPADRHLFERGQKAKSDIRFRRMLGGSCMIDLPTMIHLQHKRDSEEGRHLEVQR